MHEYVCGPLQNWSGGRGQIHVTISGAVVNNVQSLSQLQNVPGYNNPNWGQGWASTWNGLRTQNGARTLDTIHFTGHHTMGPLVGPDYFLKDLIFQNATLAQPYFLGGNYVSSKGFFPTELGFSPRLVPTLAKLGVQWSVLGNNHYSRTLKDYPYASYDANGDTLTSPPNRADLRNTSSSGAWVALGMAHEQQVVVNKFPFASTPHWVRHVDPATGEVTQVAGIPVSQNGSWLEGWDGSTTVDELVPYQALEPRQFYVIAHDGDNSSGRAGSLDTWQAGYHTTCSGQGYCLGIDEYLRQFPIPRDDRRVGIRRGSGRHDRGCLSLPGHRQHPADHPRYAGGDLAHRPLDRPGLGRVQRQRGGDRLPGLPGRHAGGNHRQPGVHRHRPQRIHRLHL